MKATPATGSAPWWETNRMSSRRRWRLRNDPAYREKIIDNCLRKLAYDTETLAQVALGRMKDSGVGKDSLEVFLCPACQRYHLGN